VRTIDAIRAACAVGVILCLWGMGPRFFPTAAQRKRDDIAVGVGMSLFLLTLPVGPDRRGVPVTAMGDAVTYRVNGDSECGSVAGQRCAPDGGRTR